MLKYIVTYFGRLKNPDFRLHHNVSNWLLLNFCIEKTISLIRGLKLIFAFKNPKYLQLGKQVVIRSKNCLTIGNGVSIGDYTYINALSKDGLKLGNYVWIGSHSTLKASFSFNDIGEHIKIGNNVGIGEYAHLGGAGGLSIGNDCIIGPYFSCHPENHNYKANDLIRNQGVNRKGITIGNNCWIGAKVTILDGVTIGDNCVIAAGAVVTTAMPADVIIGGIPARVIKSRLSNSLNQAA